MKLKLVVDGFGKLIGTKGDMIVIKGPSGRGGKKEIDSFPVWKLDQVLISGRNTITTEAIKKMVEHGVDIVFIFKGREVSRLTFRETGTVRTRREQYFASLDQRGAHLAKCFVISKAKNQYYLLGTLAKGRIDSNRELAEEIMDLRGEMKPLLGELESIGGESPEEIRLDLMNLEGRISKMYWDAISRVLPEWTGFKSRTRYGSPRNPEDPFNSSLNYGYAILMSSVWRAVHISGLDPFGGFLHVDRSGRPSLVLDVMEEFRQQVVDRVLIPAFTKRELNIDDFSFGNRCELGIRARRIISKKILGRLNSYVRVSDEKMRWSDLILARCRGIAKYLRGESKFEPFYIRW